jgi:hypothetical protein
MMWWREMIQGFFGYVFIQSNRREMLWQTTVLIAPHQEGLSFWEPQKEPSKGHIPAKMSESSISKLEQFCKENKNVWAVKIGWIKHLPLQLSLWDNAV